MPLAEVPARDAQVVYAVRQLRMTAEQIVEYSQTWDWPFNSVQELDRRLDALNLRRRIVWKKEQSKHEQFVNAIMLKLFRDAHRNGLKIWDVEREFSIPGARLRADRKFRIGNYVYYLEGEIAERSDGWLGKMRKFLRHRKEKGTRPFRVLFVFDAKGPLTRVWYSARDLMKPHPDLKLFLFGWSRDTPLGQLDSVCSPVWVDHLGKAVPLARKIG